MLPVEPVEEREVEARDAGVVEVRGHRRVDRHRLGAAVEGGAVALDLLFDVAEGVLGAAPLELVERDEVGHVEHPDLFELRRRAEVVRHDVERDVDELGHFGVALPDACRLDEDEVEVGRAAHADGLFERLARGAVRLPRRERAHVDAVGVLAVDRVHADAVAEERAARPPPRRVDGEDGDVEVGEVVEEAADEFVGERALARPARPRDADDRVPRCTPPGAPSPPIPAWTGSKSSLDVLDEVRSTAVSSFAIARRLAARLVVFDQVLHLPVERRGPSGSRPRGACASIIPWRPSRIPSSGEKIFATP